MVSMNKIFYIVSVAIILAIDIMIAMMTRASQFSRENIYKVLVCGTVFSILQVLIVFLGNSLISLESFKHGGSVYRMALGILAILIFIGMAIYMLYRSIKLNQLQESRNDEFPYKDFLKIGLLMSIDAFLLGMALSLIKIGLNEKALYILLTTSILSSITGTTIGYRFGFHSQKYLNILCSAFTVFVSINLLLAYIIKN